jgi:hypothetical protein
MCPDSELLLRLRSGDELAFVSLVERYQEQMLRLARLVRAEPRRGRRGRPGHLAGRAARPGDLRGPRLAEDLAVPHPGEPGPQHRQQERSVPVADPEPAVDPTRFDGDGGWA